MVKPTHNLSFIFWFVPKCRDKDELVSNPLQTRGNYLHDVMILEACGVVALHIRKCMDMRRIQCPFMIPNSGRNSMTTYGDTRVRTHNTSMSCNMHLPPHSPTLFILTSHTLFAKGCTKFCLVKTIIT